MAYQKVLISGSLIEVTTYDRSPKKYTWGTHPLRKKNRSPRPRGTMRRRADNLIRLRRGFVRIVRSNLGGDVPPTFITLTFVRDVPIRDAYACLTGFAARCRKSFGRAFKYIAVPEFQKRGAIHFHILAWGIPQEVILHEEPFESRQLNQYRLNRFYVWANKNGFDITESRGDRTLQHFWALGFVDCMPTDGSEALAGYLAKYMSKAMLDDRLRNERAYICSRGIMRPVSLPGIAVSYSDEIFGIDLSTAIPLHSRQFGTQWLGVGRYASYRLPKSDEKSL